MKWLGCFFPILALLLVLGTGCDYRVALVEDPSITMNTELVGMWEYRDQRDRRNRLLVLPMDAEQFLVVLTHENEPSLYGRATKWEKGEKSLIQLDWIGTERRVVPEADGARFQYVKYALDDDTLRFRLVSTDVLPEDVKSSKELLQLIDEHWDDSGFFRSEATYQRVDM